MKKFVIFSDGACSGNPGPAAVGVVIKQDGEVVRTVSKYIGEATNNIAEYTALIYGLQEALVMRADEVEVFTDSELLYKQFCGDYKVRHDHIRLLFDQVKSLSRGFQNFSISHVRREFNKEADKLARQAIEHEQAKMVASRPDPEQA